MDGNNKEASTSQTTSAGAGAGAEQPTTVLAYPPPPLQYINSIDPNNLPPSPPPITDGIYYMFGQKISLDDAIIAPLETQGTTTKRLYPRGEYDHKKELKKINASILVNFLDLVDVLVRCPDTDKRIEKCNDIATLFINFHHLINELRPHQARETLRVWLTCQKKSRQDITSRLSKEMQKTMNILEEFRNFENSYPNEPLTLAAQGKFVSPQSFNQSLSQSVSTVSHCHPSEQNSNSSQKEVPLDDIMCDMIDEAINNEN